MIRFLYNLLTGLVAIYFIPRTLIRGYLADKSELEQLALYSTTDTGFTDKSIWVHFSSMGEAKVAHELIAALRQINPAQRIICTVRTAAGRREACRIFSADVPVYYCPYDLAVFVGRALRHFQSGKLILIETELWPNLISRASQSGLQIYLVNGRISEKSFPGYARLGSYLQRLLRPFTGFIMQSELDKKRIIALGADPDKCKVAANLKYDIMRRQIAAISAPQMREKYGLDIDDEFIIAGSTRNGEEKIVISQFLKLLEKYPGLKLIIAPRHLKRIREVESYLRSAGLNYVLRSRLSGKLAVRGGEVLVLDTLGELVGIYSFCRAAFIGGSLTPLGGQNPLESVALGIPTCFGPHMENFAQIVEILLEMGLATSINDGLGLYNFFDLALSGKIGKPDPAKLFEKFGNSARYTARQILE